MDISDIMTHISICSVIRAYTKRGSRRKIIIPSGSRSGIACELLPPLRPHFPETLIRLKYMITVLYLLFSLTSSVTLSTCAVLGNRSNALTLTAL